jgi:uncharacterized protein
MTWVQTFSGQAVDLLYPDPKTFRRRDISHALARICRFTGHVEDHYSVAQHSLHVAEKLPPELFLAGLLHDAAEAYCQDVSAPLKAAMRGLGCTAYDKIEQRMGDAIALCYGVPLVARSDPRVHEADLRMLATEYRDLGFAERATKPWADLPEPYPETICCWSPERAYTYFHRALKEYT